ncbi:hypothetical protein H0I23_15775 [Cellulophaga sp. HaHaR_3_176]|uniref:hypothetical protein n=1 Tax=Cellulophaga sp. HaHaR_3_176 TaxID=1942464 RepID=UPI001C1F2327|nr:hypothetical protein [Cellulophaga sp. HaHaR_3_176]QWX83888.1 hypothetical protein H0I23_15775 [Cellulophaga sp. HaHaR_3_176]
MENSIVKTRVFKEIETLISKSCPSRKIPRKFQNLHIIILKKYYNASSVTIDYHRNRVEMDIIIDDGFYDPKKLNSYMPTLHANLLFSNLRNFLNESIDKDSKNLGFYASLLKSYKENFIVI